MNSINTLMTSHNTEGAETGSNRGDFLVDYYGERTVLFPLAATPH